MSNAKQRITLTDLREPQQMRELNRQLSWIWDQLLGGLSMKSLSSGTRKIIEGKADDEEIRSVIEQRADEILLEVGKPSEALDTGSDGGVRVKISEDEFDVDVPGEDGDFKLNQSGGWLPVLIANDISAPNVMPRYAGADVLYVNPAATGSQIAEGNYFRSMADAFDKLSGKYLDKDVRVNLAAGMSEYGTLLLSGTVGRGRVIVTGNANAPAKLVGQLKLASNASRAYVRYLNIDTVKIGIEVENCQHTDIENCVITGPGTGVSGSRAVYAHNGSDVIVSNCGLYDCERSLYVYSNGGIDGSNNKGNCRVTANHSVMFLQGTQPCDTTTWTATEWAGKVYTASVSVDQGSTSAPETEPTTVSYTMTHSDSFAGGGWGYFEDNDIRQGCINEAGNRIRGCMWFDNAAIRSALAGRTVQQASLRLYAQSGVGRGVAVSAELYGTTAQYEGRVDAPELTKNYGTIGTVEPGGAVSITIPNQAVSDLVSGAVNGFMLCSNDEHLHKDRSYSKNYARFMGETSGTGDTVPMLTVVYK